MTDSIGAVLVSISACVRMVSGKMTVDFGDFACASLYLRLNRDSQQPLKKQNKLHLLREQPLDNIIPKRCVIGFSAQNLCTISSDLRQAWPATSRTSPGFMNSVITVHKSVALW